MLTYLLVIEFFCDLLRDIYFLKKVSELIILLIIDLTNSYLTQKRLLKVGGIGISRQKGVG